MRATKLFYFGESRWQTLQTLPLASFSVIGSRRLRISKTYVGKAKDRLDLVDSDLVIADVTTLFGPYTKFVSRRKGDQPSTSGKLQF